MKWLSKSYCLGLIACLLLDLLFNWKLVRRPWIQLLQQVATLIVAFMIGTLPSIDNFAHVGGFFTGFIWWVENCRVWRRLGQQLFKSTAQFSKNNSGLIFMQSLSYGTWTKRIKIALVVLGLPALVGIYYFLIKGFYSDDGAASCLWCKYFNCIPFWPWCESKWQGVFPK